MVHAEKIDNSKEKEEEEEEDLQAGEERGEEGRQGKIDPGPSHIVYLFVLQKPSDVHNTAKSITPPKNHLTIKRAVSYQLLFRVTLARSPYLFSDAI